MLPCRARRFQAPRHALWRDQRLLTGREGHLHLELEPVCGHPAACNRVLASLFCDGRCLLLASREASATATWRCPATHPARAAGAAGQGGHRPRGDTFDSSQGARQLMDVRSHRALRSLPETQQLLRRKTRHSAPSRSADGDAIHRCSGQLGSASPTLCSPALMPVGTARHSRATSLHKIPSMRRVIQRTCV